MKSATVVLAFALFLLGCNEVDAPRAPNPPENVVADLAAPTTVSLRWAPRPRNEQIASYVVIRNGSRAAEVMEASYTDPDLVESATFAYSVIAKSSTGEESSPSAAATITTRDATPPRIIQSFPADGAGPLPIATVTIELVFSEAIDSATVNPSNVTLTLASSGALIPSRVDYFKSQQSAVIKAQSTLPSSATIKVTAGTGLKDLAGNSLAAPYTFSFSTNETIQPRVIATNPANGATDVPLDPVMTITFSERMKPNFFDIALFDNTGEYIPMRISSYDTVTNVLTFTSAERLLSKHRYSINTGWNFPATDLAGNALVPFSISFTTVDLGPPFITETFPAASATDVDPAGTIKVTFSEPMDASTINASTFRVYKFDGGSFVSGTISYDATTRTAAFKPESLVAATKYVALLTTGVKDATGVPMESYFNLIFTTK